MLHDLLEENPILIRLLRSGQAALPVTKDFWNDLAYGIGIKAGDLRSGLEDLYAAGLSAGFWGEPNPSHPNIGEALLQGDVQDESLCVRYLLETEMGVLTSVAGEQRSMDAGGSPSIRWFKTGWSPNLSLPEQENLLEAGADRSTLIKDQPEAKAIPDEDRPVWEALKTPRRLLSATSPWEQIGDLCGIQPEEARMAIQRLTMNKFWRRFALKLNPTAMGWEGCGLACWQLRDEDASKAANAVSLIRGSGDVCLRTLSDSLPYNLMVLLIGRHADSGMLAAEEISRRWNVELGRFIPVRFI
ncbi:hypothetical protein KQI84_03960 [bacterium]|nr:hypothetical protein [bacterium]